jgi:cytochrome c oxidase subunit II-like protein
MQTLSVKQPFGPAARSRRQARDEASAALVMKRQIAQICGSLRNQTRKSSSMSDVAHGLKVNGLNIKSEGIEKGKDTEIQFTSNEAGHYVGQCAHFCGAGHGSMKPQIEVLP